VSCSACGTCAEVGPASSSECRNGLLLFVDLPASSVPNPTPRQASLKRILSDSEDVIAADVGPLLKTVVATNKFEREMAAAFGGGGGAPGGGGAAAGAAEEDEADELQVGRRLTMGRGSEPSCHGIGAAALLRATCS
jgi:hypothetical protein